MLHLYPRETCMDKTGWSLQAPFQRKANKLVNPRPLWSPATNSGWTRRQRDGRWSQWASSSPGNVLEGRSPIPGSLKLRLRLLLSVSVWIKTLTALWARPRGACMYVHTRCCTSINLTQPILTSQQSSPDVTEALFNSVSRIDQERLNDFASRLQKTHIRPIKISLKVKTLPSLQLISFKRVWLWCLVRFEVREFFRYEYRCNATLDEGSPRAGSIWLHQLNLDCRLKVSSSRYRVVPKCFARNLGRILLEARKVCEFKNTHKPSWTLSVGLLNGMTRWI